MRSPRAARIAGTRPHPRYLSRLGKTGTRMASDPPIHPLIRLRTALRTPDIRPSESDFASQPHRASEPTPTTMKPSLAVLIASLVLATLCPLQAQTTLIDWSHLWNYMHPPAGALPAGSGLTEPHPIGSAPWYADQAAFDANYTGPSFSGLNAGPLGYGTATYMGTPLPPPAEFRTHGSLLVAPASGNRYSSYFRTTFTVLNWYKLNLYKLNLYRAPPRGPPPRGLHPQTWTYATSWRRPPLRQHHPHRDPHSNRPAQPRGRISHGRKHRSSVGHRRQCHRGATSRLLGTRGSYSGRRPSQQRCFQFRPFDGAPAAGWPPELPSCGHRLRREPRCQWDCQ